MKIYTLLVIGIICFFFSCNDLEEKTILNENTSAKMTDSISNAREVENKISDDTLVFLYNKYKSHLDTNIFKKGNNYYSSFFSSDFQKLEPSKIIIVHDYLVDDIFYENDKLYLSIQPFISTFTDSISMKILISEKTLEQFRYSNNYSNSKNPLVLKIKSIDFRKSAIVGANQITLNCDFIELVVIKEIPLILDRLLKNGYSDVEEEPR